MPYIYAYYQAGIAEPIYIGFAVEMPRRMLTHFKNTVWYDDWDSCIIRYSEKPVSELLKREATLIRHYQPIYNFTNNPQNHGCTFLKGSYQRNPSDCMYSFSSDFNSEHVWMDWESATRYMESEYEKPIIMQRKKSDQPNPSRRECDFLDGLSDLLDTLPPIPNYEQYTYPEKFYDHLRVADTHRRLPWPTNEISEPVPVNASKKKITKPKVQVRLKVADTSKYLDELCTKFMVTCHSAPFMNPLTIDLLKKYAPAFVNEYCELHKIKKQEFNGHLMSLADLTKSFGRYRMEVSNDGLIEIASKPAVA